MIVRVLFIGVACAILSVGSTHACSVAEGSPEPTKEALFAEASTVFVGHVVFVEEVAAQHRDPNEPVLEAKFRVTEVLKGQPPADNKVRSFGYGPGNCTAPMLAGMDYLFFLHQGVQNFVDWPSGTETFFNINGTETQALLARLRALKK
jgi:hypothetical protein